MKPELIFTIFSYKSALAEKNMPQNHNFLLKCKKRAREEVSWRYASPITSTNEKVNTKYIFSL